MSFLSKMVDAKEWAEARATGSGRYLTIPGNYVICVEETKFFESAQVRNQWRFVLTALICKSSEPETVKVGQTYDWVQVSENQPSMGNIKALVQAIIRCEPDLAAETDINDLETVEGMLSPEKGESGRSLAVGYFLQVNVVPKKTKKGQDIQVWQFAPYSGTQEEARERFGPIVRRET